MIGGAKAASRRKRADKDDKGVAKSQLKVNEQAKSIQCDTCKSTFLQTTKLPALTEHASNKHSKTLEACFAKYLATLPPSLVDASKQGAK
ncbi:family SERF protein [Rutstroemia sp. NJR-2017a BVV2]|nr:family SERF protein [Rutstroemia sp. NJR-2017a BVV2]